MKFKKRLVGLMLATALTTFTFALSSCGGEENQSSSTSSESTTSETVTFEKTGEYYCSTGSAEYTLTINEADCSLVMGETTLTGTYSKDGDTIKIVFSDGSLGSVTVDGTVLTLKKGEETYTFYENIEHTVTYETNGGSAVAATTVVNGTVTAKPADPTKDGHWFIGWYADEDFKALYDFDNPVMANTTLYARFVEDLGKTEFSVNFVVDGAAAFEPVETKNGVVFNTELPTPEKDGKVFAGWWVSNYGDENKLTYKYNEDKLGEDTTLFAVWEDAESLNVSVKPTGISWNNVGVNSIYKYVIKNASGATVYMGTPTPETSEAFDFTQFAAGEYTVEVSVSGTNVKQTAYYKNKALAKVSKFEISADRVLTFNAIDNATKYIVTVDCGDENHTHTSVEVTTPAFDFANCAMQEEGIKFSVKAVADGYMDSLVAEHSFEARLAEVTNLVINQDTEIVTWDAVENAEGYVVEIFDDGTSLGKKTVSETTVSLRGLSGNLEVKVYPVARAYNSSELKVATFNNTRLAIPMDVKLEGHSVTWTAVDNATGYKLTIGGQEYTVSTNKLDLEDEHFINNVSEIYVQALCADETKTSLKSDLFTVRSDNVMSDTLVYNNGEISWDAVLVAAKYGIIVGDGEEYFVNDANKAAVVFTQKGDVVIKVRCYNAQGETSEWVSKTVTVYEVVLEAEGGVSVASDYKAEGDVYTLPETTRTGYKFVGWYDIPNGVTTGNKHENTFTFGKADLTLYAGWTSENYTVTLNLGDNGILAETTATVAFNQDFKLAVPKSKDATKIFAGWRTQPNGQGVEYTDLNGDSKVKWPDANNDMVLYASWYNIFNFTEIKLGEETGWAVTKANGIYYVDTVEIPAVYDGLPVLSVDTSAFKGCANLKTIRIPDTIRYVAMGTDGGSTTGSAFEGCTMLEKVVVYCVDGAAHDEHDVVYESDASGALFRYTETNKEIVYLPMTATGTYYIPEGVTSIPFGAFRDARLTKISIPASVTNIASSAFAGCSNLTSLEFREADGMAEKALTIGVMAFDGCDSLEELTLPARLVNLNFDIFSDCHLKKINITGNAAEGATEAAYYSIDGVLCQGDAIVYMPKARTGWYTIPSTIKTVGKNAFARCLGITRIVIPGNVTLIEESAFYYCENMADIIFQGDADSPDLRIEKSAFYRCRAALSLTLPENLVYLGEMAFGDTDYMSRVTLNCRANAVLESGAFADKAGEFAVSDLTLGANVNEVDIAAVFGTYKLTSVHVSPDNANYASFEGALYNKTKTKLMYVPSGRTGEFIIPEGVEEIAARVFEDKYISSVVIPKSVTTIGENAFYSANSLETVTFTAGGTQALTIGNYAFAECTKITQLTIPARVTEIGANAFALLSNLSSLTLEDGEMGLTIGEYAFASYAVGSTGALSLKLESITLPKRLDKISAYAFQRCSFESIVIPEGVETIENYAFDNSKKLKTVSLPASLKNLGGYDSDGNLVSMYVFNNCSELSSITVAGENTNFTTKDGVLYIEKDGVATELFFSAKKNVGTNGVVDIPKTVTKIWDNAFYGNIGITTITFSEGLDATPVLGADIFRECKTLTSIELPEKIDVIVSNMFHSCYQLTTIEIPSTVTKIEADAFYGCTGLTTITFAEPKDPANAVALEIADGTATISQNDKVSTTYTGAFRGCTKLTSITLPARTTKIGAYAFCKLKLTSIAIPADVTTIGVGAFYGCTNLTSVTFNAAKVTTIGERAFEDCGKLSSIAIPAGVQTIGDKAFRGCGLLGTITFGEGLESIGVEAFKGIVAENLALPASLKTINESAFLNAGTKTLTFANESLLETIGKNAFAYNQELTAVIIPANVKTIDVSAFEGNESLTSITFAEGSKLESIGEAAFAGTGMTSFSLPETTAETLTLGAYLFEACNNLTTIHLSAAVTNVTDVFVGADNITTVTVSEGNKNFSATGGSQLLYNKDKSSIEYAFGEVTGELTIDVGVKGLAESVFANQTGITAVKLPYTLISIGKNAFDGCTSLASVEFVHVDGEEYALTTIDDYAFQGTAITSLNLPKNVTTLGVGAFKNCKELETVVLNAGLTTIGNDVFYQAEKLAELTIPEGITALSNNMFRNAFALTSVTIPSTVVTIGDYAFATVAASTKLTEVKFAALEDESLESKLKTVGAYAFQAQKLLTSVTFPDSVETLGNYVLTGCNGLTEVKLPDGIKAIPMGFMAACTGLTTFTVPDSVEEIGNYAFQSCSNLATVNLPAGLKKITAGAFRYCGKLASVNFAAEPTATELVIEKEAFKITSGTPALTSINLPANLTAIGDDVFYGQSKLTSVVVPESVKTLGKQVFYNCTSLTSATLGGANLTSIGTNMFYKCTNLTDVTLRDGLTLLGEAMFGNSSASYACTKLTSITIPTTVQEIPKNAFANSGLTSIDLSNTAVTSIGEQAFFATNATAAKLTSVKLPVGCKTIGKKAFYYQKLNAADFVLDLTNVSLLGSSAFQYSTVVSVKIGAAMQTVNGSAFANCSKLTTVNLADGFNLAGKVSESPGTQDSGYAMFSTCLFLETINFPSSLTRIPANMFTGCGKLVVPSLENITYVGATAFQSTAIETANLSKVTSLGASAFSSCTKLTSVTLNDTLTTINSKTFSGCAKLTSIDLPDSIATIDAEAFNGAGLTSIDMSNTKVTQFANGSTMSLTVTPKTFANCAALTSVKLPKNLEKMGGQLFMNCTALTEIEFPETLTLIGKEAFKGTGLSGMISLPRNLTELGADVFSGCNVTSYTIAENDNYSTIQGALVDANKKLLTISSAFINGDKLILPEGIESFGAPTSGSYASYLIYPGVKEVVIPSTLTAIPKFAFSKFTALERITIPNTVMEIGQGAFNACTGLTEVTFEPGTTPLTFGTTPFTGCTSLTEVVVPARTVETSSIYSGLSKVTSITIEEGVTKLGASAFSGATGITSITLPDSLKEIGSSAFNGMKITSIDLKNVEVIGASAFQGSQLASLTLPATVKSVGAKAFYNTALTSVTLATTVEEWGTEVFSNCAKLTSITLPEGVTTIPSKMFANCTALKSVDLPSTLETVKSSAFSGSGLTSIDFTGTKVTSLWFDTYEYQKGYMLSTAASTFMGCKSLTSVTLPEGFKAIGTQAFMNCTALKSITIPDSMEVIGQKAFAGTGITSISFNATDIILYGAFEGMTNLTSVSLPEGLKDLGYRTFYGCIKLASIDIPDSVETFSCTTISPINGHVSENMSHTFYQCKALTEITLPANLKEIPMYAFSECVKLETVNFNEGLEVIGTYAFKRATSSATTNDMALSTLNFPSTLKRIEKEAFYNCYKLTEVTLPKLEFIDSNAFYSSKYTTVARTFNVMASERYTLKNWNSYRENYGWLYGSTANPTNSKTTVNFNYKPVVEEPQA